MKRCFWIFFTATLLSLIGSNQFLFTQGWYLLEITGEKTTVGLTWSLFFLPSLLVLPLIGQILDSRDLKRFLVGVEGLKVAAFLAFAAALAVKPHALVVYAMAVAYGMLFATYFPSVYVVLKRLSSPEEQTRNSHLMEVSLQISNVVSVFATGFLYETLGFVPVMLLSALCIGVGALLMTTLDAGFLAPAASVKRRSLVDGYRRLFDALFRGAASDLSARERAFGFLHMFPHAIIMVSNVPLILYVSNVMGKGVKEFGVIDALIGFAAMAASLCWSRWHRLSERPIVYVASSVAGAIACIGMAFIPSGGVMPYLWVLLLGWFLVSSKVMARAAMVRMVSKEQMGAYGSLFQTVGNGVMLGLFAGVSAFSKGASAGALYVALGVAMAAYSFFVGAFFSGQGLGAARAQGEGRGWRFGAGSSLGKRDRRLAASR